MVVMATPNRLSHTLAGLSTIRTSKQEPHQDGMSVGDTGSSRRRVGEKGKQTRRTFSLSVSRTSLKFARSRKKLRHSSAEKEGLIDIKISGFELLEWAGSFVGYDTHLRYQLHSWPLR